MRSYIKFRDADFRYKELDDIEMNWLVEDDCKFVVGLYNIRNECYVECFGKSVTVLSKFLYGHLEPGELPAYGVWDSFDTAYEEVYGCYFDFDIWSALYPFMDYMVLVQLDILDVMVVGSKLISLELKPNFLVTENICDEDYERARKRFDEIWLF